ncbi:hypothetical protein WN51_12541 [Melipona quadrifasciata]|uniref:Uncharacterized protein n=1 Tax=Melipona quadrifasciata TaxID=166423 RepID=A0A0N0BHC5_9HYME|nr:hypothetical protein WN51_12541 [Melipona quadrifasciata]
MEFPWTLQHQPTDPLQNGRNHQAEHQENSGINEAGARRLLSVAGNLLRHHSFYIILRNSAHFKNNSEENFSRCLYDKGERFKGKKFVHLMHGITRGILYAKGCLSVVHELVIIK